MKANYNRLQVIGTLALACFFDAALSLIAYEIGRSVPLLLVFVPAWITLYCIMTWGWKQSRKRSEGAGSGSIHRLTDPDALTSLQHRP